MTILKMFIMSSHFHDLDLFYSYLQTFEIEKMANFKQQLDKDNYIVRHGLLKQELSKLLSCMPEYVYLKVNIHGKLELDSHIHKNKIYFTTSNSNDFYVIVINEKYNIGVDIECMNSSIAMASISKYVFQDAEIQYLNNQTDESYTYSFYKIWTAKEAIVKITGIMTPKEIGIPCANEMIIQDRQFSYTWAVLGKNVMMSLVRRL